MKIPQLNDLQITKVLQNGQYEISPAYLIKEGKYQLISLSFFPKKQKRR